VGLVGRYGLPPLPFLLALATAANTGSVATLVGNPQNMLCASLGGLDYATYAATMLPVAVVGLAINHAVLWWSFRGDLGQRLELAEPDAGMRDTGMRGTDVPSVL